MLISGDKMFLGQYNIKLLKEGLIVLPSELRKNLKNSILVSYNEDYLTIYSKDEWKLVKKRIKTNKFEEDILYLEKFVSNMFITTIDKQGQIKIDLEILDKINIRDECVVIGALNKIEIWNKEKWQEFENASIKKLPDIYDLFQKR